MREDLLSVKEFAAAAGVSTQYIYKILSSRLKPYKKRVGKKTYIERAALDVFLNEEVATNSTNSLQPTASADVQPIQPTLQPTLQPTNATDENGEIKALRELIAELKQDKEDLKRDKEQLTKDKEDLKQEAMKWQQLLLEEKNKVLMLEAANNEQKQEEIIADVVTEIVEAPVEDKKKKSKIKWFTKKKEK